MAEIIEDAFNRPVIDGDFAVGFMRGKIHQAEMLASHGLYSNGG